MVNFTRSYGIVPALYVRVHRLQALFPETMEHGISEGSCLSMQAAANTQFSPANHLVVILEPHSFSASPRVGTVTASTARVTN